MSSRDELRLRSGRSNVWGDNLGLADALNVARASVYRSTPQTYTTSVGAAVAWDTAEYDTDGMWSNAAPTRLTCRTAGLYFVTGLVTFTGNAAGARQGWIYKNAATLYDVNGGPGSAAMDSSITSKWPVPMNVGDYVEFNAIQTSGGNLNIFSATATRYNGFTACLISTL